MDDDEEEEEEEERNKKILSTFSIDFDFFGVYQHKILGVYKHLIFVVYKHWFCCVYKRSYYGLFLTIFGVKKISSNLPNFELFNRTFSSVDFFSLYWSGQTISFFPPFINSDIGLFINSIFFCHLNNFVYLTCIFQYL